MPCRGPGNDEIRLTIWLNEIRAEGLAMNRATNTSIWKSEVAQYGLETLTKFIKNHPSGRLGYTGTNGRFVANDLRFTPPTLNSYAYVDTLGLSSVVIVSNAEDICAADVVFKKQTGKDPRASTKDCAFTVYPLYGTSIQGYLTCCERRKKQHK